MSKHVISSIEQGRARFAYDFAQEGQHILKEHPIDQEYFKDDKYLSHVKKVPMQIKTNGLGAACAFTFSKQQKVKNGKIAPGKKENPKNAYDLLYRQITLWLKQEPKQLIPPKLWKDEKQGKDGNAKDRELVDVLLDLNSSQYRAVTVEVLALFAWLRRFAEGLIKEDGV